MIYGINGNAINNAYDVDGIGLNKAYDVDGNIVFTQGSVNYDNYSYTQKWGSKGITPAQGFDIYDGKVFWVKKSGDSTIPADCYVWNLSDGSQALDSAYITIYSGHGNNLAFNYPLVYCSPAYNPAKVYVNTFDGNTFSLDKTFSFSTLYDIDSCLDENDTSILWGLSHDGIGTELVITKWNLSNLTLNGDGTYTPELLNSVNMTRPSGNYMQGTRFHDSMLWFGCGDGTQRAYVYAVDPYSGVIKHSIDMQVNTEPEGVAWQYENGEYVLYVGFQGMMMRRYVFG